MIFPKYENTLRVQASILCYPVISADKSIAHIGSFKCLLGKEELTKEETEKFSLENRVSSNTPPTYIWHAADDNCVSVHNSIRMAEVLSNLKVPYELHILPNGGHGFSVCTNTVGQKMIIMVVGVNGVFCGSINYLSLNYNYIEYNLILNTFHSYCFCRLFI